jgi:hypothetical protein
LSVTLALCVSLTMLPFTAAHTRAAADAALPVAGDILALQGGTLEGGVLVYDFGDYDDVLASIDAGNRIPITVSRPKGSEAGYPVRAWFDSYTGSDNNSFRIFDSEEPEEGAYSVGEIAFAAGESSKTLYIGEPYSIGDNTNLSGMLTFYVYFDLFDKTAVAAPMIRLQTTKRPPSDGPALSALPAVTYANVGQLPAKFGEPKVITVEFHPIFQYTNYQYCKVTEELTLTLTNGTDTLNLRPVEAVDSVLSALSFVIPPNAIGDGEGWEVARLSGITNANGTRAEDFTFSDRDIYYDYVPAFGVITADKETYDGLETVRLTIPVTNAGLAEDGEYTFADYFQRIQLSIDGGESFVEKNLLTWNAETRCIEASFAAPDNAGDSAVRIAAELYAAYGEVISYRALYGAFKIIEISAETAAFVPVTGMTVTGLPAAQTITAENMDSPYPLTVTVSPPDATFGGYTWATSNADRAYVENGILHFVGEGAVTIALTSSEAAYRIGEGLPANDAVLTKSFTFLVGDMAPRLIAGSASAGFGDGSDRVTAFFYDNFKVLDGAWDDAAFSYEIFAAGGQQALKSGTAEREVTGDANGVTSVTLDFDGTTPKTPSFYSDGEFLPAYTITLTAAKAGLSPVSATANVYIMPHPAAIECVAETATALAGEEAVFAFKVSNLLPGYTTSYNIFEIQGNYGERDRGALAEYDKIIDPETGLVSLMGRIAYTPQTPDSSLYRINVSVQNPGERSVNYSGTVSAVNADAALISAGFYDGLDGSAIAPEPGDAPHVFYGLRESKFAALIGDDAGSQQAAFDYLNRMMRIKGLHVTVPSGWGALQPADGAPRYWNSAVHQNAVHLSASSVGKPVTLSWENVATTMEFTFMEDDLSGKAYALKLENALALPVSLRYENGAGQTVEKEVTPYNGYIILYEPSGIDGQVWVTQDGGAAGFRFAFAKPSLYGAQGKTADALWGGFGYERLVVASNAAIPKGGDGASPPFGGTLVTMQTNPTAKFARVGGYYDPTAVNFGVVDADGKYVEGTKGRTTAIAGDTFELPLNALFANPGSRLGVEFVYRSSDGPATHIEYYDAETLSENFRLGKTNEYLLWRQSAEAATINGAGGARVWNVWEYMSMSIRREEAAELRIATGNLGVQSASLAVNRLIPDSNGYFLMPPADAAVMVPAQTVSTLDYGFTEGTYTVLRFMPGVSQYMETPGDMFKIALLIKLSDGSESLRHLGYLRLEDGGDTAKYVRQITEILEAQSFIHPDQMRMRVGDVDVLGNVRALLGKEAAVFNYDVASVYDNVEADLAIPSQNPFTFEVTRKGDEYIIRGYVYALIMNQAGWVHLADRWWGEDFDAKFDYAKQEAYNPLGFDAFPGLSGYIEGKAVVTPGGAVNIILTEGRILSESRLEYFPHDEFDLYGFWKWKVGFEGMISSTFRINAPDDGADSASPIKFNVEEISSVNITVKTGHNGMNLEAGVYAQKVKLLGHMVARWSQVSIFRPYETGGRRLTRSVSVSTGGDLRSTYYMRLVGLGSYDEESVFTPKWYSYFSKSPWDGKPYIKEYWFGKEYLSSSDSLPSPAAAPLAVSVRAASATLPQAFAGGASTAGTGAARSGPYAAASPPARYYNNGGGMVYQDASGAIVSSDTDGSNPITVDGSGFGLDSAQAGGQAIAAWGVYGAFDSSALDGFDVDARANYAAGMSEIKVGVWGGGKWSTSVLTDNAFADIAPKTAANGTDGLVVWSQGISAASADGEELVFGLRESRLMFARYDGGGWGTPATLYVPSGEAAADYSVAMDTDGGALVTVVTDSGGIVIVSVSTDGAATVIGNKLPPATRISLLYNGETYTLACFDAENMALSLYELNTDGFVTDTAFSGIPTNTGGEFQLFRDRSKTGAEAVVLLWPGTATEEAGTHDEKGSTAETVIYASRMIRAADGNRVSLSAPLKAVSIRDEVYVDSYDAYIDGASIKVLATFGAADGSAYLDETTAAFTNAIGTSAGAKDISGLAPGSRADFPIRVMNSGISAINNIAVQIDGGARVSAAVHVPPNEAVTLTVPFTLARSLPDSMAYTVTATFADGGTDTASGSIALSKTDVAAEILYSERTSGDFNIDALVSNNTAFSLDSKNVVVGIYSDPFGTAPVAEKTIDGGDFTRDGSGLSVPARFTLADAGNLPDTLYLIAKVYDASGNEVRDRNGADNMAAVTNFSLSEIAPPTPGVRFDFSPDALQAGDTLETTAHYTNESGETVRGHLIVAFYGGQDGPCLRVVTEPFTAAAGSTVRVVNAVALPAGVETQYVKAFLWDDTLTPLGEARAFAP